MPITKKYLVPNKKRASVERWLKTWVATKAKEKKDLFVSGSQLKSGCKVIITVNNKDSDMTFVGYFINMGIPEIT